MNEIEHEVCVKRKYVIAILADPSEPVQYLKYIKEHVYKQTDSVVPAETVYKYFFVEDIEGATKTYSMHVAFEIIDLYRADTGDVDTEFVVLPLQIRYSLIEQTEYTQHQNEYGE